MTSKRNINSKTFCMHPFTGLATREDGAILVCCRSHPIGWIQNNTLEEIWNNQAMLEIRQQVLNNQRPNVCQPCFQLEDQGVESMRQRHIKGLIPEARINLYPRAIEKLNLDYTMPFEIPTMEIKLNNLCNLKCRMCHPVDSTSWDDWSTIEEFYKKENNIIPMLVKKNNLSSKPYLNKFEDNPNWWNSFKKIIPYFRRAEFAGGEPLMDPQHYKILDMLSEYGQQIELKYATNLTMLGINKQRTVHNYWPKFKTVAVNVSIDGVGDVYNYIRSKSDYQTVASNIKTIQQIPNISRIVGAVTVQISNVLTLDQIAEEFLDRLGIIFHTHRVCYPNFLSAQVLPSEIKTLAIDKLENLKIRCQKFSMISENQKLLEYTLGQIQDNINYLKAKDQSHLWQDCVDFNHRLDRSRKQLSFETVTPEFKPYVK